MSAGEILGWSCKLFECVLITDSININFDLMKFICIWSVNLGLVLFVVTIN
jgi:hypothetical protein